MGKRLAEAENRKQALVLTLLCFSVYAVSYLGRLNYSAALAGMIAGETLTKTQGGAVATSYFFCYGAGQLVNGILADRHDPVGQVTLGLLGSAGMNLLMYLVGDYRWMLAIWGLNGYCQSLIWAPVFLIVSQSIPPIWRSKSLLLLNIASPAGSMLAFAFSGLVLWQRPWPSVFSWAAGCMAIFALIWMAGSRAVLGTPAQRTSTAAEDARDNPPKGMSLFRMVTFSGGVFLILPAMIHGMLKDGITTWLPTYMTEVFSLPSQIAVVASVLLPLINMSGAVIAYFLMRRVRNELLCVVLLFGSAGVALAVLAVAKGAGALLALLLFALITALMMAANVLLCSEIPVRFSQMGRAASVSGFYNSCGYLGTAASMYVVAYVSERWGWSVTQVLWTGACVGAALCCLAGLPAWRRFLADRRENEPTQMQ